jgi:LysM repeat protein
MNNQSPFVPQGSLPEQKNNNRARVKIAVFFILAIHGVGLMALLMQGCKNPTDTTTQNSATDTNGPPILVATNPPAVPDSTSPAIAQAPIPPLPEATNAVPVTPLAGASDYKIVKGDTLGIVAKRFHVTLKALHEANPAVEANRLRIGQTIHVPAAGAATMAGGSSTKAGPGTVESSGDGSTYSVQSGDTLTRIAGKFGTTVKVIRSANHLRTDRIVVGQKLRVPAKNGAPTPASVSPPEPAVLSASASSPGSSPTAQ